MVGRPSAKTPAVIALIVWSATFIFQFWVMTVYNDHFDRISRGRQIARYGELPFRDFFDPGYFAAEFSSAAVQRLFGDNLFGEFVLAAAFIATGAVLVLLAARTLSRSWMIASIAAALAVLALPRAYDYDKFLFYPLGVVLAWRYLESRRVRDLAFVAAGIVAAALYRYDSAMYVGITALVAVAAAHWRDWRILAARLGVLAMLGVAIAAPFLLFVGMTSGLREAADQVVTYGVSEARPLQLLVVDPDASGPSWLHRLRLPPHLFNRREGAFLYFIVVSLPLIAAGMLVAARWRHTPPDARVWVVIAAAVALNLFILRPPIAARIGGMSGVPAILGAWIASHAWRSGWLMKGVTVAAAAVIVWSVRGTADWPERFRTHLTFPERVQSHVAALRDTPPAPERLDASHLKELAVYLRNCTLPTDRLFATWFVPELYFFAQRPFSGRMAATWQWMDIRFQRRSAAALGAHSPIVIVQSGGYRAFAESYPVIEWTLRESFREAGRASFGSPESGSDYRILVKKDRVATGIDAATGLACFA